MLPRIASEALRSVPRQLGRDRIFGTARGRLLTKSNWHYNWDPVRCAFGKPDLAFHELRHFTATHMLNRDIPPWLVAEQLGHSDGGELVIKLYGHPDKSHLRDRIRAAMDGSSGVTNLTAARTTRLGGEAAEAP